jgi:hypothetical protein
MTELQAQLNAMLPSFDQPAYPLLDEYDAPGAEPLQ